MKYLSQVDFWWGLVFCSGSYKYSSTLDMFYVYIIHSVHYRTVQYSPVCLEYNTIKKTWTQQQKINAQNPYK